MTIHLRCSRLDLVSQCPAAAVQPACIVELDKDAAHLGSAVHRFLTGIIGGKELSYADLAGIYGVDVEDLGPACASARHAWKQIEAAFPDAQSEVALAPITGPGDTELTGTADVVSLLPDGITVAVGDFKSGWGDGEHQMQLRGYALLACLQHDRLKARATIIRPRHGTVETWEWTRVALVEWWALLAKSVTNGANVYHPSPDTCRFCWRSLECDARKVMVRSARETLMEMTLADGVFTGGPLTPRQGYDLVHFARLIKGECEKVIQAAREEVTFEGGEFVDEAGYGLRLEESEIEEIEAFLAWPILSELPGPELARCLRVVKKRLEKAVKATLDRGNKGSGWTAYLERIRASGAMAGKPRVELKVVAPRITAETSNAKALAQGADSCQP